MILSPAHSSNHSIRMDPNQNQPRRQSTSAVSPYRYTAGSVPSLMEQHNYQQNSPMRLRDSSGMPAVEGRRRARLQSAGGGGAFPPPSRDPYKRASLHEPLMMPPPLMDPSYRKSSTPLGGRRNHTMSTLAIPEMLERTPRDFMNPANQNFILRKSKSIMYGEEEGAFRDRGFPSVDEGVSDDLGSFSDEDEEKEKSAFPIYNLPSLHSSSSSSSWIGGLFSPKFTTISANTAAKSASLSFAQMQSFTGFPAYSSGLYELEEQFDAGQKQRHISRNRSRTMDSSVTLDDDQSISIPYSTSALNNHHHPEPHPNTLDSGAVLSSSKSHSSVPISTAAAAAASAEIRKSHSNLAYSSSSGCSTQSSASSTASLSQQFSRSNKARSSLREAAQNFRDFVQHYEKGLIECISSVEEEQEHQQQQQLMNNQLEAGKGKDTDRLEHEVTGSSSNKVVADEQRRPVEAKTAEMSPVEVATEPTAECGDSGSDRSSEESKNNSQSSISTPKKGSLSPPTSPPTSPLLSQSLRLQLEKVRALRDQYETGFRCSEALERLMKLTKKTRDCDREYRANERQLAAIEAQLEAMIGTFRIKVEDLEGFARICPRDNYEVEFRHGKQRRVIRVRIGKSLERCWDGGTQEVEFRGALKPAIVCRLREVKSSWRVAWSKRNVTLGVTSISMSELLVAVSKGRQILLDANASGSLKLRIRCSWQPKLIDDGSMTIPETTTPDKSMSASYVNQSFRSENLNFALKKAPEFDDQRKASTLNTIPSLPTIPRVTIPNGTTPPPLQKSSPHFKGALGNLKGSGDLSRSLLALPSFYYSSNQVNPLLGHHHHFDPESSSSPTSTPVRNGSSSTSAYNLHRTPSMNSLGSDLDHHSTGSSGHTSLSSPSSTLSLSESYQMKAQKKKKETKLTVKSKIDNLTGDLASLQSALEDYRGQFVELTMMSITVGRLIDYYEEQIELGCELLEGAEDDEERLEDDEEDDEEEDSLEEAIDGSMSLIDEVETALAEFDFLEQCTDGKESMEGQKEHSRQSSKTPDSGLPPSDAKNNHRPPPHPVACSKEQFIDLWSTVLALHVNSSLEQLGHVGSWILKGRETQALARLRADAFAFELIYELLISGGRTNPMGKDRRVLELWQFASDRLTSASSKSDRPSSTHRPYILTWRQLCQLLIDLMTEYGFTGSSPNPDDSTDEDSLRYAAEWLSGLIVPLNMTKVTLFDLRAFFELDLWRGGFKAGNSSVMMSRRDSLRSCQSGQVNLAQTQQQTLSLKRLFQIALDVDRLMRKSKKISLHSLEQILFDRFNVNCIWIPSDVTLTMVGLLYENHSHEKQSKLTTSEVKKLDRFREMGKMATNWIIWLLQDCRFEIREHVLAGLESSTAFTRRASCYGIMYMFKLMKRSTQYDPQSHPPDLPLSSAASNRRGSASTAAGVTFFGQELDSLLYVSMEDHDGRVREEAKKALKCLGHYGQQRLNQMERSRMGFIGTGGTPNGAKNGSSSGEKRMQNTSAGLRCSMPNLNGI